MENLNTKVITLLKVGSTLFLIFASVTMVVSLLNISLIFLDLKNEIPNAKISFSANYLNASLKVEIPTRNTGFLPLRLNVRTEILFSNGSVLGTAEDSETISPGETKTMSLIAQASGNNFIKLVENPEEKIKVIFSFEIRTFFDLISVSMSTPINLGSMNETSFSTGG